MIMNLQGNILRVKHIIKLNESDEIKCRCGWKWDLKDGGNDPYVCHQCGTDNSKKSKKIIYVTEDQFERLFDFKTDEDYGSTLVTEGLHDTSWENDEGDKITLMDLLDAIKDIPVKNLSVKKLKPKLLTWDGDEKKIKKIEAADLKYPILVFVNNDGKFISIIDGHHRAQKAVRNGLKTIKGKVIDITSLPNNIKKVFSHMIPKKNKV